MKRGSALVLLFWFALLAILAGAGYYIWINYSKVPNDATRKTAKAIIKYPTAKTWQITEAKNLCLSATTCAQPVKIDFETPNTWADIYNYYTVYFKNDGWTSNTNVVTTIPTSVVFTKGNCEVVMENHSEISSTFTVACTK